MSSLSSDQDHLNPNDQLYYAPRWLRERAEPLPASPAPPEKRSQSLGRPNTPPPSFDALLEEAVAESLRHPLGDGSSVSGILQSMRTALSQPRQRDDELKPALSEFQAILASPSPQAASPQAAPAPLPVAREESESSLLQSFVQWQQKPPSPSAP